VWNSRQQLVCPSPLVGCCGTTTGRSWRIKAAAIFVGRFLILQSPILDLRGGGRNGGGDAGWPWRWRPSQQYQAVCPLPAPQALPFEGGHVYYDSRHHKLDGAHCIGSRRQHNQKETSRTLRNALRATPVAWRGTRAAGWHESVTIPRIRDSRVLPAGHGPKRLVWTRGAQACSLTSFESRGCDGELLLPLPAL